MSKLNCGVAKCGNIAVAAVLIQFVPISQVSADDKLLGHGLMSTYRPVCEMHKWNYPDHDGFKLGEAEQ